MNFTVIEPLRADLHLHSTASDGRLTPEELVAAAAAQNLQVMALTDHETMHGLPGARAAAKAAGITFIPGVEINTEGEDEVHVLLYFVREDMQGLVKLLDGINRERERRGHLFVERFGQLGIKLTIEDFRIPEGTYCNRVLVATALARLGHVSSIKEAFDRYLAVGKSGYVGRSRQPAEQVIRMAVADGAVPVLAHPDTIKSPSKKSRQFIETLKEAGLMGIEAYHSKHSTAACRAWEQTARELGLLVTGGSDYHAIKDTKVWIGNQLGRWTGVSGDVRELFRAANGAC